MFVIVGVVCGALVVILLGFTLIVCLGMFEFFILVSWAIGYVVFCWGISLCIWFLVRFIVLFVTERFVGCLRVFFLMDLR